MDVMARAPRARESCIMPNPQPEGLDETAFATQVGRFYDKVRADPLLGPVFNPRVDDWDAHKVLMTSFWATVALGTGHYRGNPLARHQPLPIGNEHFARWLKLWRETAHEVLAADAARLLTGQAERIGYGLRIGMGLAQHQPGREHGALRGVGAAGSR
jgi:hemoglobin